MTYNLTWLNIKDTNEKERKVLTTWDTFKPTVFSKYLLLFIIKDKILPVLYLLIGLVIYLLFK